MIAFASVFLMKIATKWTTVGLNVNLLFVWNLLDRIITLLKSTVTSDRHLVHHIAAGLEKMLAKSHSSGYGLNQEQHNNIYSMMPSGQPSQAVGQVTVNSLNSSLGGTIFDDNLIYESFGMDPGNDVYDFLASQFSY